MRPQGTVTENIADIIQVLQFARKTGILIVERNGLNGTVERGTFTLINGQITDGTLNISTTYSALQVITEWRTCSFVFRPSPIANVSLPTTPPSTPGYLPTTEPLSGNEQHNTQFLPVHPAPRRVSRAEEVIPQFNAMGLSRSHRQLFLLVDGKRTSKELMRLMRKGLEEVEDLLTDLERAGLIQQ